MQPVLRDISVRRGGRVAARRLPGARHLQQHRGAKAARILEAKGVQRVRRAHLEAAVICLRAASSLAWAKSFCDGRHTRLRHPCPVSSSRQSCRTPTRRVRSAPSSEVKSILKRRSNLVRTTAS
eukprot:6248674-Prymnesium_polylepis.1